MSDIFSPHLVSNNLPPFADSVPNGALDDATEYDQDTNGLSDASAQNVSTKPVHEELPNDLTEQLLSRDGTSTAIKSRIQI